MTEPTPEAPAEAPAEGEKRTGRGRPRPSATLERDEQVFTALDGPKTKEELHNATQLKPTHIYLSLLRLKKAGRVQNSSEGAKRKSTWERTEVAV